MNYCDENSTPRDRISAELFFSEYGTEMRTSGCGCGNTARTAQTRTTGCGCGETSRTAQTRSGSGRNAGDGCTDRRIPAPSLAMAYVPMQQWRDILNCEDALANGTLFGELVLPFYPTPCNNEGCQRRRSI